PQRPAVAGRGPAAADRHVPRQIADDAVAARDRPAVRGAGPHDGAAFGPQGRTADEGRRGTGPGDRAAEAHARGVKAAVACTPPSPEGGDGRNSLFGGRGIPYQPGALAFSIPNCKCRNPGAPGFLLSLTGGGGKGQEA